MNRLLTLGLSVSLASGVPAADPVSVYPAAPGGTLSQPLTSVVAGGIVSPATVPPVMVSQPAWGGAMFPRTTVAPCDPLITPLMAPRYLAPPQSLVPCRPAWSGGCASRGNLLDRIRTWLCGGTSPSITRSFVPAIPVAPLQAWFPGPCPTAGADCATGVPSACDGNAVRGFPMGRFGGRFATDSCPAPVPVVIGPRPVVIPLPSAWDRTPTCGGARPGLLRRILAFFTPRRFGRDECQPTASVYGVPYTGTPHSVGGIGGQHLATPTPTPLVSGTYQPSSTVTTTMMPIAKPAVPLPNPVSAAQPFTLQK